MSELGAIIEMMADSEPLPLFTRDNLLSSPCFHEQLSPELPCSSLSVQNSCTEQEMSSVAATTAVVKGGSGGSNNQPNELGKNYSVASFIAKNVCVGD